MSARRRIERNLYSPGAPLNGFPRSHALARLAYLAKRCDFLLAPFPACSLTTRRIIGAPDRSDGRA